jgi:N-acetyl-gamma-glutamyl-phosphate reductase
MKKIKAGIIGAAGYTGGELIRLLINHPSVEIAFAQSGSNAGNPLYKVHADLLGDTELVFSAAHHFEVDVLFFCAGHGEAKKFVAANEIPSHIKLIDIGNDFRLTKDAEISGRTFVYGLPELQREKIKSANNIANPGCFATTIQLGLLPLAKNGLLPAEIFTTGITGSTGAGQSLSATSHFSWRQNNISAYKTLTHQHNDEIKQTLHQLQNSFSPAHKNGGLFFVPWRGDFTRGIFISSQVKCKLPLDELTDMFRSFYSGDPFTHLVKDTLNLKQVVNTNKCLIQLEKVEDMLVVHSILDNLVKGASGQAVQNMNLIFGLDETTGLKLKAAAF